MASDTVTGTLAEMQKDQLRQAIQSLRFCLQYAFDTCLSPLLCHCNRWPAVADSELILDLSCCLFFPETRRPRQKLIVALIDFFNVSPARSVVFPKWNLSRDLGRKSLPAELVLERSNGGKEGDVLKITFICNGYAYAGSNDNRIMMYYEAKVHHINRLSFDPA